MKSVFIGIVVLVSILQPAYSQTDFSIPGMPAPGQPKPWSPPKFSEDVLPNGVRVIYIQRPGIPLIDVTFVVDAGAASEPPHKSGVAFLTAEMITGGRDPQEALTISSSLARYSTIATQGVDHYGAHFSLSMLKESFPQSISIMIDLLMNPGFDSTVFQKRKERSLSAAMQRIDNPVDMTTRTLLKTMFDEEVPFAYSPQGRYRDLYDLTVEDCMEFHRSRYTPQNMTMIITGDIDYPSLKPLLTDRLAPMARSESSTPPVSQFSVAAPRIVVIDNKDVRHAIFRVGYPCTSRKSADFATLLVLNEVFGAGRGSRLNRAFMGERVLSPNVGSGVSFQRDDGYFVVSGSIPSRYIDSAFAVLFETIDSLYARPPSAEELFEARKVFTDNFDLEFTTNGKLQSKIKELVIYGLRLDFYQDYLRRFHAVTTEDVLAAANVLFRTPWVAVITGDASVIKPALEQRFGIAVEVLSPHDVIAKDRPVSFVPEGDDNEVR